MNRKRLKNELDRLFDHQAYLLEKQYMATDFKEEIEITMELEYLDVLIEEVIAKGKLL